MKAIFGLSAIWWLVSLWEAWFNWSYHQTSRTEDERIVNKTQEYGPVYVRQIEWVSCIDSLIQLQH